MKKGKLYTVNPYNKIAFMPEERNYFAFGDALYSPNFKSASYGNLSGLKQDTVGQYLNSKNFLGISKQNNPFSKINIGNTIKGAAPALGSAVGGIGKSLISNGFSTGIGEGIASVGSTIGNALSSVDPVLGGIVSAGAGLLGGAWNAGFGVKYNDNVINGIKDNASRMDNAGNALAQADTNASVMDAARGMGSTVDIDYHDLGSTGFLRTNNALKREKARLDKTQNLALARQNQGLITGASQADQTLDDNVMGTFIYANGGPLYTPDTAIGYGLATDYMNNYRDKVNIENKMNNMNTLPVAGYNAFNEGGILIKHPGRLTRLKERTGKTEAELYNDGNPAHKKMVVFARNSRKWRKADGGPLNILCGGGKTFFDFGGDMGTNSSDFTTGLMHIDEGGSHETNPNEGVQVGVDSQGIPNLVEEGETIYDDYVYSNRIKVPTEALKFLGITGKDISFADASKQLEREIKERVNDPISKTAYKNMMYNLSKEQEFVKNSKQYQTGGVYDVNNEELSLLNKNGFSYERID